jgi:hypothetical protein
MERTTTTTLTTLTTTSCLSPHLWEFSFKGVVAQIDAVHVLKRTQGGGHAASEAVPT